MVVTIIIINYKNNMLWMAYLTQNKEEKGFNVTWQLEMM